MQANWNATLQTLEGHSNLVNSVTFSPDGKLVVSGRAGWIIALEEYYFWARIYEDHTLYEKLNPATMSGDVHHHSNSIL